jgi:hypothetical protein
VEGQDEVSYHFGTVCMRMFARFDDQSRKSLDPGNSAIIGEIAVVCSDQEGFATSRIELERKVCQSEYETAIRSV